MVWAVCTELNLQNQSMRGLIRWLIIDFFHTQNRLGAQVQDLVSLAVDHDFRRITIFALGEHEPALG